MSNDILERFQQVQPALHRPFGYILSDAANDGKITFMQSRITSIIQRSSIIWWLLYVWLWLSSPMSNEMPYLIYAVVFLFPVLFLFNLIKDMLLPQRFFKIDSTLRSITLYDYFPKWSRKKEIILVDDIQLFVSYVGGYLGEPDSSCYVVMKTGQVYSLISNFGRFSPDLPTNALGYICGKLSIHVTEYRKTGASTQYKPQKNKSFDVEKTLGIAETLYDPDSGAAPDFSK
ncbi:MAG: hypothetical protein ACYC27_05340 [Armatimonadota bacterium]